MLTIMLGVTTYWFFRSTKRADIKAKNAAGRMPAKAAETRAKNDNDTNELKRLIGVAKTEKVEAIDTDFKRGHEEVRRQLSRGGSFLSPSAGKDVEDDRREEHRVGRRQGRDHQAGRRKRRRAQASKQPQIDEFKKAADKAEQD